MYKASTSRGHHKKRHMAVWKLIMIDFFAICVALTFFAYFHHINPIGAFDEDPIAMPIPEVPTPKVSARPNGASDGQVDSINIPKTDLFLAAGVTPEITENTYKSDSVNITVRTEEAFDCTLHIAEVYVADVQQIKEVFAGGEYKTSWSGRTVPEVLAEQTKAFLFISTDQFAARKGGVIVRNGVLYRKSPVYDVCVLGYDGTLSTYKKEDFDIASMEADGVWQAWTFGPMLLQDGLPMTKFYGDSYVYGKEHPRMAIGMIEPLHYIFVAVDGRQKNGPQGIMLSDLSRWLYDNGAKTAYNLDGGATACMIVNGQFYNIQAGDRNITNGLYVGVKP